MIYLKQLKAYLLVGLLRWKWHSQIHTWSECSLQLQRLTQVHWYLMGSLQFQQRTLQWQFKWVRAKRVRRIWQHICIELAHPTQLCYFQFRLFVAVSLTWYLHFKFWDYSSLSFNFNLSYFYKWAIQSLLGFFLLFLLSRTENLCSLIFLYILMFHQDHLKYHKGYYGKLKLNICFQSLGGQFYTLRVLCRYNSK